MHLLIIVAHPNKGSFNHAIANAAAGALSQNGHQVIFHTQKKREQEAFGDPLEVLWKTCIFDLCGVRGFYRKMFGVIVTSRLEQRQQWLTEVRDTVKKYFPAKTT